MENHRKKSGSGDKFSFPIIVDDDEGEFEFGCNVSTSSPCGSPNSPADRFFSNGKLLPHEFPCIKPPQTTLFSRSRTSSVSSKDSLMSSSRSSSSSSSSCCSARTSTSESSADRRLASAPTTTTTTTTTTTNNNNKIVTLHDMIRNNSNRGTIHSTRRWQFMVTPGVLQDSSSRKRNRNNHHRRHHHDSKVLRKQQSGAYDDGSAKRSSSPSSPWFAFGMRILRSFVSTCKECHAIQPSVRVSSQLKV